MIDATSGKTLEPTTPEKPQRSRVPLHVVRPRKAAGTAANRRPGPAGVSGGRPAFPAAHWLSTTCRVVTGLESAAVFDTANVDSPAPMATWPAPKIDLQAFRSIAASAAAKQRCIIAVGSTSTAAPGIAPADLIALPLAKAGYPDKVVTVRIPCTTEPARRLIARRLNECAAWLPLLTLAPAAKPAAERSILEALAQCLEQDSLRSAAMAIATHLATLLGCERVSIAMLEEQQLRLIAVSAHGNFDERTVLSRSITGAMAEAIEQDATVQYPAPATDRFRVAQAHAALCQEPGIASACTIPLAAHGKFSGAATFESAGGDRFDPQTVAFCEALMGFLGPLLATRRRAELSLQALVRDRVEEFVARNLGPRHLAAKLLASVAVILVLVGTFVPGNYRIKADAVLRGAVQRLVVAPVDGFIAEAPVRAGDVVKEGQVLVALDQRALQLEQIKWSSERDRLLNEYRAAMAELDSSKVTILRAQVERATAELTLAQEQLARSRVVAPFAGVVVSGDLTQAIGAPVKLGDTLFEVAPLDGYRVMLQIDERDIGEVAVGQHGRLALSGFPGDRLDFVVERITPVSKVTDGRNLFGVEARLLRLPPLLRPGMQGVAKLDVGSRRLGWIWTHRATEWLALAAWRWLPAG
jgi:multidrug resistance efflux pump